MEGTVKEAGFDSLEDWQTLTSEFPLETKKDLEDFEKWKREDGTKEGLLKLYELQKPITNLLSSSDRQEIERISKEYSFNIKDVENAYKFSLRDEKLTLKVLNLAKNEDADVCDIIESLQEIL